jgi:IS5 family transposase
MSKSIHTTIASTRRDNSRAELDDPDNADVASLARKTGYKRAERRKRLCKTEAAREPDASESGSFEA